MSQVPGPASTLSRDAAHPAEASKDPETLEGAVRPTAASKLSVARPPYPAEVRRALDYGRTLCRQEGGTSVQYPASIVRTGDLTGDGRADYVIDFRGSVCRDRSYMFSGTGGWDLEVLVSRRPGGLFRVFSGRVRDYDVSDGPGPRVMTFTLHGGYCGLAGADDCVKTRRIDGQRFAFRDR